MPMTHSPVPRQLRVRSGVERHVLVQRHQIVPPAEGLRLLHGGAEQQTARTVRGVVGGPDQLLIRQLQQIGPVSGGIDLHAPEHAAVHDEAQHAAADAVPIAVIVAVGAVRQVDGVGGAVRHQLPRLSGGAAVLGRAAEPHVRTGGGALVRDGDTEQLLEMLTGGGQV